jgi:hypothetical protein
MFSAPVVDPPFEGRVEHRLSHSPGCATSGKEEAGDGGELYKCSACHIVRYCSKSCQSRDWRSHKQHCTKQRRHDWD